MPKVFVLCTLFCLLSAIMPQKTQAQQGQFRFRHLTTEDGIPTNSIYQVIKDVHGMIWITTGSGLCRYDGYDIKTYQYNPDDLNSLTLKKLLVEGSNLFNSPFKPVPIQIVPNLSWYTDRI